MNENTPKKRGPKPLSPEVKEARALAREQAKATETQLADNALLQSAPRGQAGQATAGSALGVGALTQGAAPLERGTTGASMSPVEAEASHLEITPDRATAAHEPDRPARIRMHASSMLDIPFELDRVNFYYRWMNEGRIAQAKQAYYEVVAHPETGEAVKRTKGAGTCVLMRLPIEYRLEDLQFKREQRIQGLSAAETGGVDKTQDEYSGLEGRKGAIHVQGGFDPNAPYNAYT